MDDIYRMICIQASEETNKYDFTRDVYFLNESDGDDIVLCKSSHQREMEFYRKCLTSGITRHVCDSSISLEMKIYLLLEAVKQDLPIQPQHYLAIIKQMKQSKTKNVLEQKFNSLKRKRSVEMKQKRKRIMKYAELEEI